MSFDIGVLFCRSSLAELRARSISVTLGESFLFWGFRLTPPLSRLLEVSRIALPKNTSGVYGLTKRESLAQTFTRFRITCTAFCMS